RLGWLYDFTEKAPNALILLSADLASSRLLISALKSPLHHIEMFHLEKILGPGWFTNFDHFLIIAPVISL
ncbi:MAG: hypothetical protein IPN86_14705, partial [Saprospiraceae bacterium]|nr:hypothetical protein [Saprospiraceae bacterium]